MVKKLILVVDDEEISLEMIASVLESDGYRVLKASDAKTALEIFERNKMTISVVLMDLVMPEYNGFIAIKTIKTQKLTRLIPIMVLTASTDKESGCQSDESWSR